MYTRVPALPDRGQRIRLLWLIAALWTTLVAGLCVGLIEERLREHREHTGASANLRLAAARDTLLLTFRQLAALPRNLAHRAAVRDYLAKLQLPDTSVMSQAERAALRQKLLDDVAVKSMNAMLADVVADFGLQLATLMDSQGTAVADGVADKQSMPIVVAENWRLRGYFTGAMRFGQTSQFLLGHFSRVPGLYFSQRVDVSGRPAGVIVVKQDAGSLNRLFADARGSLVFVTDANGVIVMGNREDQLLRRLPNAPPLAPSDSSAIYQRTPAPLPWRLSTLKVSGEQLEIVEWDHERYVLASAPLAELPFTAWVAAPLGEENAIAGRMALGGTVAWMMGCFLIWAGGRRVQLLDRAVQAQRQLLDMAHALPLTVFRYRQGASDGAGGFTFIGRGVRELLGVDERDLAQDPTLPWRLAHAGSTPPTQPTEFPVRHGDRVAWVMAHSTPLQQSDGSTVYNGYWLDISARREAQARLAAVFEHAPNGYVFFDRARGITHCNPAACALFGVSDPASLLGRIIWYPGLSPELQPDGQASRTRARALMRRHIESRARVQSFEWRFRRIHGPAFDADVIVIVIDWEGEPQYCAVIQDVTSRKQAQAAMQEAREAAEAASQTKSTFLANMSHELRTPMNAIIGMTHLALEDGLPPRERDYIEKAHAAARNLLQILNDILDVSKIESGRMALEQVEFDLETVVSEIVDVLGLKADEKGLALRFRAGAGLPTRVVGDPTRLRQVLLNLCSNAIKFTDAGEVLVGMEPAGRDDHTVQIHAFVRDTGVGLSEHELSRLFQPFMQADSSTTRRFGGTGLGLVISRQLVERMGGRLWVDSRPGEGSTFHFSVRLGLAAPQSAPHGLMAEALAHPGQAVPMRAREQPGAASRPRGLEPAVAEHVRERLAGARILLAEDHPLNQELARELLRRAGMQVVLANNGQDALDKLESEGPFDGVLMDCQMPVMDGYTATRRLRADPRYAKLPVIAMTASALAEDRERAFASGMDAHISKPLNVEKMLTTMAHWISSPHPQAPPEDTGSGVEEMPEPEAGSIDTADGLARCLGKWPLYRRILSGFREANRHFAAEVQDAWAHGRWDTALRRAHDLKGLAGTIGAHGLHQRAGALQTAFSARDDVGAEHWLAAVRVELDAVIQEIDRLLGPSA
jgi:PAS domain S-box-containing protein